MHEIVRNDRVIGGVTPEASRRARELYASFVRGELLETDDVTAELCKLLGPLAVFQPFGEGDRHLANGSAGTALLGFALIVLKNALCPRLAAGGANMDVLDAVREGCEQIREKSCGRPRPLVMAWPQALSYQAMFFADARVVLASGGTGSGYAYNQRLEARVRHGGMAALSDEERPDFLLCAGPDYPAGHEDGWRLAFYRDGVRVYERRASSVGAGEGERACARV